MAVTPPPAKHRILCLHGYMQNAETFRNKMGSWRKGLKSQAEFIFMDAPYLATASGHANDAADGRTWWTWNGSEGAERPSMATQYSGWEDAEAAIASALRAHEPVHGLLGFSQGACCASLYLAHCAREPGLPAPRFAILCAAFLPRDKAWAAQIQEAGMPVPSLHVWGLSDAIITAERSQQLLACCDSASTSSLQHPGAHMMPTCSGQVKADLRAFLTHVGAVFTA